MPRPAKPAQPKCQVCKRLTATQRVRLTPFGGLTWTCRRCAAKKAKR